MSVPDKLLLTYFELLTDTPYPELAKIEQELKDTVSPLIIKDY